VLRWSDACCDIFREQPDDVGYLDAVLEDVAPSRAM